MSVLRIRASLAGPSSPCQWALSRAGRETLSGEATLAQVPRGAKRIQVVIPAAQVSLSRTHLPPAARRRSESVLAYAIEDETAGDPDSVSVAWLGTVKESGGHADVLAATDKAGLAACLGVLESAGLRANEVQCETLLLPWAEGEWALSWDGSEGFIRTGALEGGATDCGDTNAPPLAVRMLLDEARARGECPESLAVHVAQGCPPPDAKRWEQALGIPVRIRAPWAWQAAQSDPRTAVAAPRRHWGPGAGVLSQLRPALSIVVVALVVHALALLADWRQLANEQSALRESMTTQFRVTFPDAVAVVDPVLQMRRKIAEARHAAGRPDAGDFLPLFEQVAAAANELKAGVPRTVTYDTTRIAFEFPVAAEAAVRRVMARLLEAGLGAELRAGPSGAPGGATVILAVRTP